MMTRFCGRERKKGKAPAAQTIMNIITIGIQNPPGVSPN